MFFATGNGFASQLDNVPVSGRNPPTALEEAAVHMTINGDGSLTVVDFFMPWEKKALDGADKDLGTSPLEILPSQFSCGVYQRIGVVTGKSGKTYWIDLDNMGGYQNGPNKLDAVIQVTQNENSVYAGAGVYPLEGGYVYINVIQYKTHVFKFTCSNGVPSFTQVADSPEKNAYILGVGHGTVTSLNDQPGTGLVWTSDVEGANLRIYDAVPRQGVLRLINSFVTPGTTKFTRPVFGNGIAYQGTTQGFLYAYGAPVNLPLDCSSPYDFGVVSLGATSATRTVQCRAKIAVTVTAVGLSGNNNFAVSGIPTLPLQVAAGSNFSFSAAFSPQQIGSLQSDVLVNTTQAVAGYSINTPVRLKGVAESTAPVLSISPNVLSFDGTITGQAVAGVNQTVIWSNLGNAPLTVQSIQYSLVSESGPFIAPTSTGNGKTVISAFTIYNEPASIAGKSDAPVIVNFNPPRSGGYAVYMKVTSNGGTKIYDVIGTGADYPVASLEFQTPDATGWIKYNNNTAFTFGNVTQNTIRYLKMRLTNVGTINAARLSVTVSKPPFGVPGIIRANNQIDLGEGTTLGPGESATATLYCAPPKSQVNVNAYSGTAVWTMNLGDPNFGKQVIQFFCNAVSEQYPPLNPITQQGIYRYYGCFKENNPGRQLQTQVYGAPDNRNGKCIAACSAAGYIFAATQYNSECWCGNYRPKLVVDEKNCNFPCSGNVNEVCGGNGINQDGAFMSLFGDNTRFDGNVTKDVGPFVNPGVLGFTSLGCYTEATTGRALSKGANPVNVTIAGCIAACASGGNSMAGMEYGGECVSLDSVFPSGRGGHWLTFDCSIATTPLQLVRFQLLPPTVVWSVVVMVRSSVVVVVVSTYTDRPLLPRPLGHLPVPHRLLLARPLP
jgi:WSC domain